MLVNRRVAISKQRRDRFSAATAALIIGVLFSGCSGAPERDVDTYPRLRGDFLGVPLPGRTPEIFAPGTLSHGFHENGIVFSSDGNGLFFSMSDGRYTAKTFICMSRMEYVWSSPHVCPFTEGYYVHSVFLSPDENTLFFSSKRPFFPEEEPKQDLDVWVVAREGTSWREPVHLDGPLNTEYSEQVTSIAANGTIYLRTNYEGPGKWAIYRSRFENGSYSAAEKLSATINSGNNEGNPFIAPDLNSSRERKSVPSGCMCRQPDVATFSWEPDLFVPRWYALQG